MKNIVEQVCLYYTDVAKNSDKVYQVRLIQTQEGFLVEYSNGKRGSTLVTKLKTEKPVDEETARTVYERTKKAKLKDGYTEDVSGETFKGSENAERKTKFSPQLLTAIDEDRARQLISGGAHIVQIKHDGERRYLRLENGEVTAANRQGLEVVVAERIRKAASHLQTKGITAFELDCEDMKDHVVVFDVLSLNGKDLRAMGFIQRFSHAAEIETALDGASQAIRLSHPIEDLTWETVQALREAGQEGICLKQPDAPYKAGRNESQLKLKFWESATTRVAEKNKDRRSVSLEVLDESGNWLSVGNVTVPQNVQIPEKGQLLDVRYLYAHRGGSLFEPTFEKVRTDLPENSASVLQLKFKGESFKVAA